MLVQHQQRGLIEHIVNFHHAAKREGVFGSGVDCCRALEAGRQRGGCICHAGRTIVLAVEQKAQFGLAQAHVGQGLAGFGGTQAKLVRHLGHACQTLLALPPCGHN